MEGLAPIEALGVLAILAKAAGYTAALLAMGGALFLASFPHAPEASRRVARNIALVAVALGLTVLAVRFGIRAARISGMGFSGAVDPMMLGFVWESPLGTAAVLRSIGLVMVLGLLFRGMIGTGAGLLGALLIAASYTFVGHSLGDPRWLLAGLLTVHLLAAAFWVGALAPLHRATATLKGADLLHRFGVLASGTVAILVLVGVTFAWLMVGSFNGLITTAYGWTLVAKVAVVSGLMGLAALNKLRFVPALAQSQPNAARHLRRSIKLESLAVGVILIATATLTSVTTPPVNL